MVASKWDSNIDAKEREREREGGREREREGGRERGREGEREGGREKKESEREGIKTVHI